VTYAGHTRQGGPEGKRVTSSICTWWHLGRSDWPTPQVATTGSPEGVHCVSVSLAKPVPSGDVGTVLATGYYTQVLTPFPEEVVQGENQLMLFVDNLYALSPYLVSSQNTEVRCWLSLQRSWHSASTWAECVNVPLPCRWSCRSRKLSRTPKSSL
jgi:hypothetical protein